MTTNEIRKKFLAFFAAKGHAMIASDSLVPKEDPTVLFTTAGMQQFKKQFLGQVDDFTKAATSQKCLRTDDLDKVGVTAFHHTFFEMLGNFSFGDYFKKEAITWAWEFLTEVVALPKEKLWVSVYKDDQEAKAIWLNAIKIDPKKIVELGDKSNFWPAEAKTKGPNGPCGPCSEIFYDYGENVGCKSPTCNPDCSCGRFSEIWNLVFTQYNRQDGGILSPLPNQNIDTGMGLERLAAVIQKKKTNFEIDIFAPILTTIDTEAKKHKITLSTKERYVLADHARAIVFGIADGVVPSNDGRGYIMKRLITDAADIVLEKCDSSFIGQLVPAVVEAMKSPYPELASKQNNIMAWIQKTEEAYKKVRQERIPELKKEIKKNPKNLGPIIFKYRDTYGLTNAAINNTADSISLSPIEIKNGFHEAEKLMDQQREKSRAASKMTGDVFTASELKLDGIPKTTFVGYDQIEGSSKILALFKDAESIKTANAPEKIKIVLDKTPFYAESGGQVGDTGTLS
ncbi:MAG: alanine--tRNA ligase, partial [Candidatus Omnitrophica bacterium]|nr:alanine--tRNA ligase [Candidatus Omnitrophota bacterium]